MGIIDIESLEGNDDVHVYASLTESQLRNRLNPDNALFIAESPKVIKVALQAGYDPVSILCERKHIEGDAAEVIAMAGDIDVFTGSRELLQSLTGYRLTRGVLCAMRRPALPSVDAVAANASRIVVIDGVTDTTNIGAIFRSAAALGIDAVLLTPTYATRSTAGLCVCRWVASSSFHGLSYMTLYHRSKDSASLLRRWL